MFLTKNLIYKKDLVLALTSFVYFIVSLPLYYIFNHFLYRWIAWNLFLACLPLAFSTMARIAKSSNNNVLYSFFLLLWLAFFPNAPYLVTDLVHVSTLGFSRYYSIVPWFGLFHMSFGIALGTLAGLFSLDAVINMIGARNKYITAAIVAAISLASGYAIYIGRFLRFNSWDLVYPVKLIEALVKNFNLFTILFSLLVAAYVALSYVIFSLLKSRMCKE